MRELDEIEARAGQLDGEIEARVIELDDVGPAALSAVEGSGGSPNPEFREQLGNAGTDLLARLEAGVQRFIGQQRAVEQATEGVRALDTRRAELGSQPERLVSGG